MEHNQEDQASRARSLRDRIHASLLKDYTHECVFQHTTSGGFGIVGKVKYRDRWYHIAIWVSVVEVEDLTDEQVRRLHYAKLEAFRDALKEAHNEYHRDKFPGKKDGHQD